MWAVPGLPIHSSTIQQSNQPHPAATAAAAMLSGCYEAVSSDLSPLKKKKLSSILINRDTPILRTVLGQGQADSSQPVSLVCHPDSHDSHGSDSEHHRMTKVSFPNPLTVLFCKRRSKKNANVKFRFVDRADDVIDE